MNRETDVQTRVINALANESGIDKRSGWKNIAGLFIIQFMLSQLFLSYGMYSVYLKKEFTAISEVLWSPLILITVWKICNPVCRDIAESFSQLYFRWLIFFGTMNCVVGVTAIFFSNSLIIRAVFYGGIGGFGTSLILCLIESRLYDIFQYQSTVVYSMKHLSSALGLFLTPHLLNYIFYMVHHTSLVFLYHGTILLHVIPASFLLGKLQIRKHQRLSRYSYFWGTPVRPNSEVAGIKDPARNWKNPSDRIEHLFENHEDLEHETPVSHQKCTLGVEIMPEIIEENEEEFEEVASGSSDRNSILLNNNIKNLSIINNKFEVLIDREESEVKKEKIVGVNKITDIKVNVITIQSNATLFKDSRKSNRKKFNPCCCSSYQKFRYRKRMKSYCEYLIGMALKPIITSSKVLNFYPCLLSVVHSMISPLVFLNFMPILASEDLQFGNLTEISFMLSITAFAYICFLITIPWVADISKRNLRYLYLLGMSISATAVYLMTRNKNHDYMTVSCLVYGFGYGTESYCLEIVIKEYLGVRNWTKVEGTLDFLSGIFLIVIFIIFNKLYALKSNIYVETCLKIVLYSYLFIIMLWIIFPAITYFKKSIKNKNKLINRYSFMQHS